MEYLDIERMEYMNIERIRLIQKGSAQEHYEEWANTGSFEVRRELAYNGYMHDILIDDDYSEIRTAVMQTDPSYIRQLKDSPCDQSAIYDIIDDLVEIELDVIEAQIKYAKEDAIQDKHLKTKYEALSREPTLLERTMDRVSLFLSGSPMWARDLTFFAVWCVWDRLQESNPDPKVVKKAFEEALEESQL